MKRIVISLSFVFTLLFVFASNNEVVSSAEQIKGIVVYDGKYDYHIVETKKFYVIIERYTGPSFSRGDIIYGDLHSYGFKMVKVNDSSSQTKVYIENYWTNIDKCYDWLKEHNKMK